MALPRANCKGSLTVGARSSPMALYTPASISDPIAFHPIKVATRNCVRRVFVDAVTGMPLPREGRIKEYALDDDHLELIEPDEILIHARYEPADAKRAKAKLADKPLRGMSPVKGIRVVDLMEALRVRAEVGSSECKPPRNPSRKRGGNKASKPTP